MEATKSNEVKSRTLFNGAPGEGIAVIDTETTGVLSLSDRIIEIAIVSFNCEGTVVSEYQTLINPNRDLGPTSVHGIRAGDVRDAPFFHEIAGDIIKELNGKVIAGHNIQFDLGMLAQEFIRMKLLMPPVSSICTLQLAYSYGPGNRRLSDCCEHFKIPFEEQHTAISDAKATAALLETCLNLAAESGITALEDIPGYRPAAMDSDWPVLDPSGKTVTRTSQQDKSNKHPYLATILSRLPDVPAVNIAHYYSVLDRALEDRRLEPNEISTLILTAVDCGLSKHDVLTAHRDYLRDVIKVAYLDDQLTESELDDIHSVAHLLGFEASYVDEALQRYASTQCTTNSETKDRHFQDSRVCFTGEITSTIKGKPITRKMAEELATKNGLIPVPSVTKKTDLLVVADPDTMSGKAKKARDYGTRIIAENVFWKKLGVATD